MLACFQQLEHSLGVLERQAGLGSYLWFSIATAPHSLDVLEKIDRPVLPSGEVLDQAHHQTFLAVGLDDERRNGALSQGLASFEPALTTDQVILGAFRPLP